MKITLYSIMVVLICFSCKKRNIIEKSSVGKAVSISQITTNYDTLIKRVVNKGDVDSYNELFYGFMDANQIERTDSIMKYSQIMAEKFNNENAYLDYFEALCRKYDLHVDYSDYSSIDISKMDKVSKKRALDWLNKMVKNKIITEKKFAEIKK
jgi:hypothetical protein